ncbi:hypothetical protein DYBT9275_03867 [Dyadobacter sp. CECT 9275]|uniref:HTH araC/xylS-type domain-containing protein n=1 Tax=Dyadobacter helix TaxID=2822344 RepID=A0A916N728_9BACT|nr:helix-turn-helix domain-containing protein [Dyadobacter sp. CECT 9275]CAG5006639.1 hypothetical protein DYBT9275_03867 [Dyadobacter sp. CECT 9275]
MQSIILNTGTISCLLFLAILTAYKKSYNSTGYRFLALLFVCLSFDFADEVLIATGVYAQHPWLAVVLQPVLYLFAPLIYLAVVYLTSVSQKLSIRILYHFIPYLAMLGIYLKIYIFTNTDNKTLGNIAVSTGSEPIEIVLILLFFVQALCYQYYSILTLNRHRETLPLFVSNLPDNDYHWLRNAIIGLSILFAISFAEVIFVNAQNSGIFPLIYLIGFYYVGLQVVKQKDVFSFSKGQVESFSDLVNDHRYAVKLEPSPENEPIADSPPANVNKADRSGTDNSLLQKKKTISDQKLEVYQKRLLEIMEAEKPYMDSEITLPKLGKILLLNTYQTSYLINTCFGENFYTFINRYRLEECKKMLSSSDYSHLSILGIAYESRFNSKTAFNTAFKKHTGCSPKEFRDRNIHGNESEISSDLSSV